MKNTKILFVSVALILFVWTNIFAQNNAAAKNLTAAEWREDLRYVAETLPKAHKNLFHKMKREEFETAIKNYEKALSLDPKMASAVDALKKLKGEN